MFAIGSYSIFSISFIKFSSWENCQRTFFNTGNWTVSLLSHINGTEKEYSTAGMDRCYLSNNNVCIIHIQIVTILVDYFKGRDLTKLKIGKRNIKTAIAVFISVLTSNILQFEYPFFTVIAAIFTMENSIASSYKAGIYRLIGTLVGAFTGVLLISILPGNAFLISLGTLIVIFICNTFKWDRAVPIAGVVFASIMLSLNNKNPLKYSFSRVLDTFAGIVIAVIINHLIFPPDNLAQMRKSISSISEKISIAIKQFVCFGKEMDLDSLQSEIVDSIKYLETYKIEFNPKMSGNTDLNNINTDLDLLRSILSNLETIDELGPQCSLNPDNVDRLRLLDLCDIQTGEFIETGKNTVYNYHIGRILDTLPRLTLTH